MLFADDANSWIPATTALAVTVGFIAQIVLQVMAKMDAGDLAKELKETAAATEKSEKTAATKRDETLSIVKVVHKLVNNDMHRALETAALLARRIANMDGATEEDITAAVTAEKALVDHDSREVEAPKKEGQS